MKQIGLLLAAILALSPITTTAGEKPEWRDWAFGERLRGNISWFRPNLDTDVAISNSQGNLGAFINLESSLGLSDAESTVIFGGTWRISKRNSLLFNYFKLDRDASQGDGITITIGDETFVPDVDFPIASYFDIEALNLLYTYSVIMNPKHELAIGAGLSLQDLSFGLEQTEDCGLPPCDGRTENADSTAPLPTLTARYQYAINDKWIVSGNLGWLAVSADLGSDEDLDGSVWNINGGVRWKAWKHVGFSLVYNYLDLDVDYDKRNLRSSAKYKYNGPQFGIDAYF